MQKEGYKPSTIKARLDCLKCLVNRGAGPDLLNPERIKEIIAKQPRWGDGYKANMVVAYTTFLTMHDLIWSPPRYSGPNKMPWIPLEQELDTLITSTGKRISIFLHGLKETGADPGELGAIEWTEINARAPMGSLNDHPKRLDRKQSTETHA